MILRTMDDLGRVVIPATIRRELGLKAGDELAVDVDDEGRVRIYPDTLTSRRQLLELVRQLAFDADMDACPYCATDHPDVPEDHDETCPWRAAVDLIVREDRE